MMQFFTSRRGSCDTAFGVIQFAYALHLLHVYVEKIECYGGM